MIINMKLKNRIKSSPLIVLFAVVVMLITGCSIRFSFSGASISDKVNTVSVSYFPNMAAMVAPSLSATLTDELIQKIQQETRLEFQEQNADVTFEGEIIDYRSEPIAISGNEYAVQNRLTIAVRVRFVNIQQEEFSFNKSFTAYADYPSDQMLTSIEGSLIPEITKQLVDDIFNAAFSNW